MNCVLIYEAPRICRIDIIVIKALGENVVCSYRYSTPRALRGYFIEGLMEVDL